ncbi:MAG: GAF domain-containing protein [Chloroflexaceae bacterium]|nr:GAF domain-containing protein [Chloroflexaceae bacterium]
MSSDIAPISRDSIFTTNPWAILDVLPDAVVVLDSHGYIHYVNQTGRAINHMHMMNQSVSLHVGMHYLTVCTALFQVHQGDWSVIANGIRAVITGASERYTCEYWYSRTLQIGPEQPAADPNDDPSSTADNASVIHRVYWFSVVMLPYFINGNQGVFIQHRDITEQKQSEIARLTDKQLEQGQVIRQQSEYMEALHDTTLGLIGHLDVDNLLEAILQRAAALLHTRHGYIYLVEPEESVMVIRLAIGVFTNFVTSRVYPGEGLSGKIWLTGQPLLVEDYETWSGRSEQLPMKASAPSSASR